MRVFVTGASGHIGSAVVRELIEAGHEVTGLARSDASAAAVQALGAAAYHGDLHDPDSLRGGVAAADAVVHLAFDHETMFAGVFGGAVATDLAVVQVIGDGLAGSGKAFVAVGVGPTGDTRDATISANPRSAVARAIQGFSGRGVRTVLIAVPPVTHSSRDKQGFIPMMINFARNTGVSGYVDEGGNHWPAAHTLDVATLFALAVEKAPAGSQLWAATEEGIPVREIAEVIGRKLGLPAKSVPAEEAADHFKGFPFITMDILMPNESTRELLGWQPSHPGLFADLEQGHYFDND